MGRDIIQARLVIMKKEDIKKITEAVLKNAGVESLPIPVEKIAEGLGMSISYAPSEEYSGMLVRKKDGSGKVLVGINSAESRERQRFTIAHEVGHFFLHKDLDVSVDYRMSYSAPKPPREQEADEFAGNLLMPKKLLVSDFDQIISNHSFLETDLKNLAKKYAVSTEAMRIRLLKLGLI